MKIDKRKTVGFVVGLLVIVSSALMVPGRAKTSLNNGWRFHRADAPGAREISFADTAWQRVNLPHTWNVDDPWDDEPGYYRGPGWYRRHLAITKAQTAGKIFLYFEGANQVAEVFVNGKTAGSHIGGYSAFAFDITDHVTPGTRNLVAVRVDNSFSEDIPPLTADFNFYGGIYRDVWLVTTDKLHLDVTDHASPGIRITTPNIEDGIGKVSVSGTVVNDSDRSPTLEIVTTISNHAGRTVARAISPLKVEVGKSATLEQSTDPVRNPKLWSPDSPYLYRVTTTIRESGRVLDEVTQPLGFRWFSFDGEKGFSLNGKPLKLRGTNRHQDYAGLGNAVPDRLHVRDIEIIKDAGFNFIRLAHYPQDPAVLEACDRLGLLVWEETPLVNYITKSAAFSENSAVMVREMIRQHRNHPSILLWGYMNEIFLRVPNGRDDLYPATVELARELNRIAKAEDPTRPTTIAFHGNDVYNTTGLGDIPDVIGWNLYQGWYSATVENFGKFLDSQHERFPRRPLIVSEYGANGDRRLSTTEPRRFDSSIEYQRFFHESYMAQIEARPYLSGSAIWSQFDFGSEYRGETIPHLNQKGMLTADRKPKDIHYFYRAKLSTEPILHIAVRDAPRRAARTGTRQAIGVYTNLSNVELLVNGKSFGEKSVDGTRKAVWDVELMRGANKLVARGTGAARSVTDVATLTFEQVNVNSNELAINVGSNADFTDSDGTIWIADKIYSAGSWGFRDPQSKRVFSRPPDPNVVGTTSDPLFQTYVEDLDEYVIDLPDGSYDIELLFVEPKFDRPGQRVFDVIINGKTILEKLDLAATAGQWRAHTKRFSAVAKNGLSIKFIPKTGESILSGIRVTRHRK